MQGPWGSMASHGEPLGSSCGAHGWQPMGSLWGPMEVHARSMGIPWGAKWGPWRSHRELMAGGPGGSHGKSMGTPWVPMGSPWMPIGIPLGAHVRWGAHGKPMGPMGGSRGPMGSQ